MFLPVVLIEGMAARLVSGIAFTVVLSTLVSLVVAVLLIPALAVWLLPRDRTRDVNPGGERLEAWVYRILAKPWTVLGVTAVLTVVAVLSLLRLGSELLPPADPRQFSMRVVTPPGQKSSPRPRRSASSSRSSRQPRATISKRCCRKSGGCRTTTG